MTAYVVLLILLTTALVLALDRWPVDVIALAVLLLLVLSGILTLPEGLAGFSAPVTLIVAAMYMLGAGLRRTGTAAAVSNVLARVGGTNERRLVMVVVLIAGALSAFMSNLAVFALMLPAVMSLVERYRLRPGKLLLPLAVACNVGGMVTLIGTTPNLAASELLARAGYGSLGLLSITRYGLPTLLFAAVYLPFWAQRYLPAGELRLPVRPSLRQIARQYGLSPGLQQLRVRQGSDFVGRSLSTLHLREDYGISVLEVQRGQEWISPPGPETVLEADDLITVEGTPGSVAQLASHHALEPKERQSLEHMVRRLPEEVTLAEVLVPPRSPLVGRTPREVGLRARFGIHVLALAREEKALPANMRDVRLRAGDGLLVEGPRAALGRAVEEGWLIVVHRLEPEPGAEPTPKVRVAVAIVLGMIATAALGILPLVVSSLLAVLLMVLTGCLKPHEMYRVVDWRTVIMVAALLPLGTAMEKSGAAGLMGDVLVLSLAGWGARALIAGFFLLALVLTQVLSNTAVAVLLTPVAVTAARSVGVSPQPLVVAVALAASGAFLTPLTETLNIIVRETGGYRFRDYLLASAPVLIVLFLLVVGLGL